MTRLYLSNDTSSRAAGADRLAEAWADSPDLEIIRTSSRGAFFLEPMVERDMRAGRVAWSQVVEGNLPMILAGIAGTPVTGIPFLNRQARHTFANFGQTQPLSLDEYRSHGGLRGLEAAQELSSDGIMHEIKISRLRGRGGAAFPVWDKWEVARKAEAKSKFVVANADEGDAGTYCDRMVMEGDPFRLIEGMLICALAIGADTGYIYCRHEYPAAARTVRAAIAAASAAGMFDLGKGSQFGMEVFEGAGSYVCGEETALLESLEGRRGVVRVKPPYPAQSGLHGCPTFEYTFFGVIGKSDLGIIGEYLWDSEQRLDAVAFRPFQNDVFVGLRWSRNNPGDGELLAGMVLDVKNQTQLWRIEYEERYVDRIKLEVTFEHTNAASGDPVAVFNNDDRVALELSYVY